MLQVAFLSKHRYHLGDGVQHPEKSDEIIPIHLDVFFIRICLREDSLETGIQQDKTRQDKTRQENYCSPCLFFLRWWLLETGELGNKKLRAKACEGRALRVAGWMKGTGELVQMLERGQSEMCAGTHKKSRVNVENERKEGEEIQFLSPCHSYLHSTSNTSS